MTYKLLEFNFSLDLFISYMVDITVSVFTMQLLAAFVLKIEMLNACIHDNLFSYIKTLNSFQRSLVRLEGRGESASKLFRPACLSVIS